MTNWQVWTEAERSRLEEMSKTQLDEWSRFVCAAALSEIGRLRDKLNADSQNFELECCRAEIKRLRAEQQSLILERDQLLEVQKGLNAEIERLKGELTEADDLLLLVHRLVRRGRGLPTFTMEICDWLWNRELQPGIDAAADRRLAALRGKGEK